MKDLVEAEAFLKADALVWRRTSRVAGRFFGTAMGLMVLITVVGEMGVVAAGLFALVLGSLAGWAFGALWGAQMRKWSANLVNRVYSGDTRITGDPPHEGYEYRLPCGWVNAKNLPVGGVLYVGSRRLRFVPYRRYRQRVPILELDGPTEVAATSSKTHWTGRIMGLKSVPAIAVTSDRTTHRFTVPAPDELVPRLRTALGVGADGAA